MGPELRYISCPDIFGFYHFVIQVAGVSHGGGNGVGNIVLEHQQGHVFLGLALASRGGGDVEAAAWGGTAALHAGACCRLRCYNKSE